MNTFGTLFRLTTFGESHGPAMGGIIDGVPAGMEISLHNVQSELDRRRPGNSALTSARQESDIVQFLSGIYQGRTLGTPIGFIIPNNDARSSDYEPMRHIYRPSHADFTYDAKYGLRDWRGGGRASARETACRVVGGAVARQYLCVAGIEVTAFISRIGSASRQSASDPIEPLLAQVEEVRREQDSVGGEVTCTCTGVPAGIGEPVAGKLHAMLAAAMTSIPGVKGVEFGDGFALSSRRGSETVDIYVGTPGGIRTLTNHSGGIQGGISTGMPIDMRIAFKPTPTIARKLMTVDDAGRPASLESHGRHDPCIAMRAVHVVEAMACMTLLDAILLHRAARW